MGRIDTKLAELGMIRLRGFAGVGMAVFGLVLFIENLVLGPGVFWPSLLLVIGGVAIAVETRARLRSGVTDAQEWAAWSGLSEAEASELLDAPRTVSRLERVLVWILTPLVILAVVALIFGFWSMWGT